MAWFPLISYTKLKPLFGTRARLESTRRSKRHIYFWGASEHNGIYNLPLAPPGDIISKNRAHAALSPRNISPAKVWNGLLACSLLRSLEFTVRS